MLLSKGAECLQLFFFFSSKADNFLFLLRFLFFDVSSSLSLSESFAECKVLRRTSSHHSTIWSPQFKCVQTSATSTGVLIDAFVLPSGHRGTRVTDEPLDEGTVTTGVEHWLVTALAIVAEPTAMFRATCDGLQTRLTCSFIMTY